MDTACFSPICSTQHFVVFGSLATICWGVENRLSGFYTHGRAYRTCYKALIIILLKAEVSAFDFGTVIRYNINGQ